MKKIIRKKKSFFRKMVDPTDHGNSSKRFITLIISFHFIVASFFILFLLGFLPFIVTKGNLEMIKIVGATLERILEYDFYIILVGLGLITTEQLGVILVERAKAMFGIGTVNQQVADPTTSSSVTTTTTMSIVEQIPN